MLNRQAKIFLLILKIEILKFLSSLIYICGTLHNLLPTLKNGILMVGQNAVLTSEKALEQLIQQGVSLNLFLWHLNSYLTFDHLHGVYMGLEWHTNVVSRENSNCSIRKTLLKKLLNKFLSIKS